MAALGVSDLVSLAVNETPLPGHRIVVIPTERENPALAGISERLSSLRYVIGAPNPGFLRGLFSGVVTFHAQKNTPGQGVTGVASRLIHGDRVARETFLLTQSSQRPALQEKVTAFFQAQMELRKDGFVTGTGSFPKNVSDVLDEFLMNAIWDACRAREACDRSLPISLPEGEQVCIEVLCDGENLVLAVDDVHGTFPPSSMSKPIRHALGLKPPAQINEGPGGAGLGLYMILQKVACLAFEVERGRRTRALAILRADQSLRELQKRPRSVIFFET
jgi:hypothetical protein